MKRHQLWNLLADGPLEYRPLITGALTHRFHFFLIDPGYRANTVPLEAIDDRWVALVRDQRPPSFESRGPIAFSWTLLKRLAPRATFAFTFGVDDQRLYRELGDAALMGARIIVVNTNPEQRTLDDWEDFLDENVPNRAARCRTFPRTYKRLRELGAFEQSSPSVPEAIITNA